MQPLSKRVACAVIAFVIAVACAVAPPRRSQAQAAGSSPTVPSPSAPAAPPPSPPAVSAKLAAAPVKFGQYTMRPPHGYRSRTDTPRKGSGHLYAWASVAAGGDPCTLIIVGDSALPASEIRAGTPEKMLRLFAWDAARSDYPHGLQLSPVDDVAIDGVKFAHIVWSGAAKRRG